MSTPDRIQKLLDAGFLQETPTSDGDVEALWQKAVISARDARNPANSLDNRYVLGYQALLQMGTAVLACTGYRTRGAQGHHANTFHAVEALEIAGLNGISMKTERIRQMRKVSAYEAGSPIPQQIDALFDLIAAVMPHAQRWLAAQRSAATFLEYRG
ncbi:MAG TPA: hypothetical protein VGX50_14510 [Longimicrobium sp.]|jgi:hypothetical protein|nr:hypothetical protein [Longimicrobium sp.]